MGADHGTGSRKFEEVLQHRLSRRKVLQVGMVASAATLARPVLAVAQPTKGGKPPSFTPIEPAATDEIIVPGGFRADVLIRWGDAVFPGVPALDIGAQTAALQEQRAGFNCDYLMYFPLPLGSSSPFSGLLWMNQEYTDGFMMFPGYSLQNPTQEQVEIELAAHGATIVRVRRDRGGTWSYLQGDARNRRITGTTPMQISGPAAGHQWLQTSSDPTGEMVLGMLNNCGGGITPWGTAVTAEENFNQYFGNAAAVADPAVAAAHARYGIPSGESDRKWERFVDRFDLAQEPNEPFRFGWLVEVDPYDPGFTPRKRTAIGRFKHEAAAMVLNPEGRVVIYSGDDERFEHVYKFVSDGTFDPANRAANLDLLDHGTLFAARFDEDGTGEWLPLTFGTGPLVAPAFTS